MLIDVRLSKILNFRYQVVISKNEPWIKQSAIYAGYQITHIVISGRRGDARALEGVECARVSNLWPWSPSDEYHDALD